MNILNIEGEQYIKFKESIEEDGILTFGVRSVESRLF